jgi:hypothetical protein
MAGVDRPETQFVWSGGASLEFEDRGEYELKGVDGTWRLHRALS